MNRRLRIDLALIRLAFRNHWGGWRYTSYRLLSFLFFTFLCGEFWRSVLLQRVRDFGFDANDIIWYCGAGQLIMFASSRVFVRIEDDVLSGNIAYNLTRPVDYLELRLAEGIGGLLANLSLFLPVGYAVLYAYTGVAPKGSAGLAAACILLASLLHMLFQVLAGFTGVWLHEVQLVYRIYQKMMCLVGGLDIPVSVYPAWMQYVSWATPLGLMISCSATATFIVDRGEVARNALLLLGWLIVLMALTLRSYRSVHRHICVNGG